MQGLTRGSQTTGGSVPDAPVHRLCPCLCQVQRPAARALRRSRGSNGCPGTCSQSGGPNAGRRRRRAHCSQGTGRHGQDPRVSVRPGWVGSYRLQVDSNIIWVRECSGTLALGRFPTPWGPLILPWAAGPWAPTRATPEAAHSPSRGSRLPHRAVCAPRPPRTPLGAHKTLPSAPPLGGTQPSQRSPRAAVPFRRPQEPGWHPFPGAPRHPRRSRRGQFPDGGGARP